MPGLLVSSAALCVAKQAVVGRRSCRIARVPVTACCCYYCDDDYSIDYDLLVLQLGQTPSQPVARL
jgi:hypothetical protein